jgi:hypothetical protein
MHRKLVVTPANLMAAVVWIWSSLYSGLDQISFRSSETFGALLGGVVFCCKSQQPRPAIEGRFDGLADLASDRRNLLKETNYAGFGWRRMVEWRSALISGSMNRGGSNGSLRRMHRPRFRWWYSEATTGLASGEDRNGIERLSENRRISMLYARQDFAVRAKARMAKDLEVSMSGSGSAPASGICFLRRPRRSQSPPLFRATEWVRNRL